MQPALDCLDKGVCHSKQPFCKDNEWHCGYPPTYEPQEQTCDGLDNDCDGQTDEGLQAPLADLRKGVCEGARKVCQGDQGWQEPDYDNIEDYEETEETCDGLDNDCNGQTDETFLGQGESCGRDEGECIAGHWACIAGQLVCAGEVGPAEEVCDGRDNDCNGEIDESFPNEGRACGTNEGECQMGFGVCEQGEEICQDEVGPVEEVCDGLDNDCNGMIDDVQGGCDCVAGDSELCGSDVGLCERGIRHCNDGVWGQCEGEVGPVQEVCDEDDNDCDGMIDEEFPGMGDPCGSDIGSCEQGSLACVGGEEVCQGQVGPSDEICDGLDNDCDEEIDEGGDDWCAREQGDGFLCVQGECRYDCPDDDFEENDTIAEAHALPEPDSFDATVCVGDDDFFVIDVCEHAELEISTAFDADLGDLDMQLLDSEGNEVASSTGAGSEEHIELGEMEPGLYYLRVYLFSGVELSYDLRWSMFCPECVVDDDCEEGFFCQEGFCLPAVGSCRQPIEVRFDDQGVAELDGDTAEDAPREHRGSCVGRGPELVYHFRVEEPALADFHMAGDQGWDTGLYLRARDCANGAELACNDDCRGQIGESCFYGLPLRPDTEYFLFADGYGEGSAGPFRITIRLHTLCEGNDDCGLHELCELLPGECGGEGACLPRPLDCEDEDDPVCGCDGVTYRNDCVRRRAGAPLHYVGECQVECLDLDGDGYGIGDDCLGPDCDDQDPLVHPGAAELCDGVDNDCNPRSSDGVDEEWLGADCDGEDSDLCDEGIFLCVRGQRYCTDDTGDTLEVCDGEDNDCNGLIDDDPVDAGGRCGTDVGECEMGIEECVEGQLECIGGQGPEEESCDGQDNDCDGQTDENGDDWCAENLGEKYLCVEGRCLYDCPVDEFEENDSRQEAFRLRQPGDIGAVVCADDDDFFAIRVCEHGDLDIVVSFEGGEDPDLDLELLNSNGELVRRSAGTGPEERIELGNMELGLYFIRVYLFKGEEVAYQLHWDLFCPECWVDDDCPEGFFCDEGQCRPARGSCRAPLELVFDEEGHAQAQGDTSRALMEQRGRCVGRGRERVYHFRVDDPVMADFLMRGEEGWDTGLYLRAGDCEEGEELACNDDCHGQVGESCFHRVRLQPDVDYFVYADGFQENSFGPFTLIVDLHRPCTENGDCPRDEYCEQTPGECEGLGACLDRPEACLPMHAPVCGCNGQTYENDCLRGQAGVSLAYVGECQADCIDEDEDGYGIGDDCLGPDCDDQDPEVHPGASEVCDRVDNDCSPRTPDGADEGWFGVECDGPDSDACEEGGFVPGALGRFDYAYRYSRDEGRHWFFGDLDGSSNGYQIEQAGSLQVLRPLVLSEVLYDVEGDDDRKEWVEIYNPNTRSVDLRQLSLGHGGNDYTYTRYQLQGEFPAGGCWVVGVRGADQEDDFVPDLQNSGRTADAIALFDVPAEGISREGPIPLDAVIFGGANLNELLPDEEGNRPGHVDVGDAPADSSIERVGPKEWRIQAEPTIIISELGRRVQGDCRAYICHNGFQDPAEEGVDCGHFCGRACREP